MSIVISNATKTHKIVNKKFIYLRGELLDYLKSNRLLYLKSPLNQLLYHWSGYMSGINQLHKKSKKLSRNEFKNLLLEIFERAHIEVKTYKRQKEKSDNVNNRQKAFKDRQKEISQFLQFYVNKDTFQELEKIRLSKHLSKQDFYSSIIEKSLDFIED